MKTIKSIRTISICLVILICITIFLFSASPSDTSKKHSGGITDIVFNIIYGGGEEFTQEEYAEKYDCIHLIVRKAAHFSIYLCLGFSTFAFACTFNIKRILKFSGAFLFSVLYAASDEFHQLFVSGRCGCVTDVFIDSLGAAVGIILSYIIIYRQVYGLQQDT